VAGRPSGTGRPRRPVAGARGRRPPDATPDIAGPAPVDVPDAVPAAAAQPVATVEPAQAVEPAEVGQLAGAVAAPVPTTPDVPVASAAHPAEGPDVLVVGRIGKPQGIKGEVTVEVRTDAPDTRFADGAVLLTEPAERGPLTVAGSRDQNGRLMVAFAGVSDRNAAELLRDTLLLVDAADLPPIDDPDEFHDVQLVGLTAVLADGTPLGRVGEVLHLPHGDVLVVRREAGPELLVPFVAAIVPEVDLAGGRLVVEPPEGLLDLAGG
jgi:16S rRNA processing protein RimM